MKSGSVAEMRDRARIEAIAMVVLIVGGLGFAWHVLGSAVWAGLAAGFGALLHTWWPDASIPPGPWGTVLTGLFFGLLLFVAAMLASRWYWWNRRRHTMIWYEIRLFQDDTTEPARVRGVFDQLWDGLYPRHRWVGTWAPYRWFTGTTWYTWAVARDHAVDDQIHLLLGAPADVMDRVLHAWQNIYQNVRFEPWKHGLHPPQAQMLRWRVHHRSWLRLTTLASNNGTLPVEAMLQAISREGWRGDAPLPDVCCTYTFTPIPTHRAWQRLEQGARYAEWEADSPAQSAARSAITQVGRGRWQTEWRAATTNYDMMQRILGAWALHNHWAILVGHNVVFWRRLFHQWFAAGVPRLWGWHGPKFWSGECATFFPWPTGRLRISDLNRSMTRRMPAPRPLVVSSPLALMQAEGGQYVGLKESDRHKNVLLLGIQGSGKSTSLLNMFRNDVLAVDAQGRPAKAVILVDIGKDTAKAALRLVPPDRKVIWFAPASDLNTWLIQPFVSGAQDGTQMEHLLDLFQEIFGEEAIGPRSRQILGHVFATVIAAGTEEDPPTFDHAYQMLADETVRDRMVAQAAALGRLPAHTADYWSREYPQLNAANPGFWQEAAAAPRNKLDAFLRNEALRGAIGAGDVAGIVRKAIDWERVIRERQVVIMDLDQARMSRQSTALFGVTATLLLWHAIQRQGLKSEADRIPVSLLYDEAQEYLSPQFLRYLALGRAYGFQTALCTRFLLEIEDDRLRAGLVNLCQNRIIHRIPEEQDAKALMMQMMTVYINNINLAEEVQGIERFMADDIMRLPDRQAICVWQADGAVQSPFHAYTIDWRPFAHEEWALAHLAHQPVLTPSSHAPTAPEPPKTAAAEAQFPVPETPGKRPSSAKAKSGPGDLFSGWDGTPLGAMAHDDHVPVVSASPTAPASSPEPQEVPAPPTPPPVPPAVAGAYDIDAFGREFRLSAILAQRLCTMTDLTPDRLATFLRARPDRPTFQGAWIPWLEAQGAALSAWRDAEAPAVAAGEG